MRFIVAKTNPTPFDEDARQDAEYGWITELCVLEPSKDPPRDGHPEDAEHVLHFEFGGGGAWRIVISKEAADALAKCKCFRKSISAR